MLSILKEADESLFLFLNGINHPIFDPIMVFISGKITWLPLYLILLVLLVRHYRWESIRILLFVAVLISLSDQLSVQLFKDVFERLRPCHEPHLQSLVHLVDGKCGGQFGFVSSHAANSFALAFFLGNLLSPVYKRSLTFLIAWAAVVSYSRIYLGVHYPADILVGAMLGVVIGWLVLRAYRFMLEKLCPTSC